MPSLRQKGPKKKPQIRYSLRQRKAMQLMVKNGGNVSKAMRDAGYTEATARIPQNLTRSQGFLALADELGLTDKFLTEALVNDIKKKPKNRHKELELGFKIRGRLKEAERPPINVEKAVIIIESSHDRPNTGIPVQTLPETGGSV